METDVTKASNLFIDIMAALAGSQPEWRLPKVDPKAVVSEPQLTEPLLISESCFDGELGGEVEK